MNVTPKQVLSQIKDIEIAVRNGLHVGNIKAVMKEQKAALKKLFTWQREVLTEEVQKVFHAEMFLWAFVVAWAKSEKTGDQKFIEDQRRAMTSFDENHGVTATAVTVGSANVQDKARPAAAAASAGTIAAASGEAFATTSGGPTATGAALTSTRAPATASGAAPAPTPRLISVKPLPNRPAAREPAKPSGSRPSPQPAAREPVKPSGSRPSPQSPSRSAPVIPAMTASGSGKVPEVAESSGGGSDEDFEEEGETEVTDSDADADTERKADNRSNARTVPRRGSQRTTPCSRCVRLRRDCYEQVNGKTACYHCCKSKVRCETEDVSLVVRATKGKGLARRKVKKAESSSGYSVEESLPRRFTKKQKGKSKAIPEDIEMADPDARSVPAPVPVPAPAPTPRAIPVKDSRYVALTSRITGVERDMYEQARWVEGTMMEPITQIQQMWDIIRTLSNRVDELQAYLGLQDGAQPIILNNGIGYEEVYHIPGHRARTHDLEMTSRMEEDQAVPDPGSNADYEVLVEEPVQQEGKGMFVADAPLVSEPAPSAADADPVEVIVTANAKQVEAVIAADAEQVEAVVAADVVHVGAVADAEDREAEAGTPAVADAEQVEAEVSLPASPRINILPPTPHDSQETAQHPTFTTPPLPPLLNVPSRADADPSDVASAPTITNSPIPPPETRHSASPPPAQLRRSPRLLSPTPSGAPSASRSRSTTPQSNLKKRVGTSEDRGEVKRGRKG